jgi:hypothetical protein
MVEEVLQSEAGRRLIPWFVEALEKGREVSPELAGRLVVFLASGQGDGLSGRFVAVEWDVEGLARQAGELANTDALTLRLEMPRT